MEKLSVSPEACAAEVRRLFAHRGEPGPSEAAILTACDAYAHTPKSRTWSAVEVRKATAFLREIGFRPSDPLELNQLLPPGTRAAGGGAVEEANVFLWPTCAFELCVAPDTMLETFEQLPMDTVKWSRRAPKTNGRQNKLARHNCCVTDLEEEVADPDPGDVNPRRVKHKHPKNSEIKFTNYSFAAIPTLLTFRERFATILGPFGYKVRGMFAEVNKYPNTVDLGSSAASGIGRHGDTERGGGAGPGTVCCLRLGAASPLLFAWYRSTRLGGRADAADPAEIDPRAPSVALVPHKDRAAATAVVAPGHGSVYIMSRKAVGFGWKKHDWALRHCAGGRKYTNLPKQYYANLKRDCPSRWAVAYSVTFSDYVENDSETPELQFGTPHARAR